jgi:Spx/MgsR family transcriptional regulator
VIKVYGITNCSTVKKARAWLDGRGISYQFVDFKKTPPNREEVARWCSKLGKDVVVNARGTTWRKLDSGTQSRAATQPGAIAVLVEYPSAIKRPIVEAGADLLIGFDEETYEKRFAR